jgi:hypothetical protein
MPRRLFDLGAKPLLEMPHAAYRGACRVRLYAAWVSPKLFGPDDAIRPFGIDLRLMATGSRMKLSAAAPQVARPVLFAYRPRADLLGHSRPLLQLPSQDESAAAAGHRST